MTLKSETAPGARARLLEDVHGNTNKPEDRPSPHRLQANRLRFAFGLTEPVASAVAEIAFTVAVPR